MDLSRLNEAMWNYYKIQDQIKEIADVTDKISKLSSPPQASTSASTGISSSTSEKGTQANGSTITRQTPRF
jgi:hypothetical protein